MQAQVVVHAGAGGNRMNQMATFCLGERAHPLRHLVRRKRPGASDYELLLITHLISDLWAS